MNDDLLDQLRGNVRLKLQQPFGLVAQVQTGMDSSYDNLGQLMGSWVTTIKIRCVGEEFNKDIPVKYDHIIETIKDNPNAKIVYDDNVPEICQNKIKNLLVFL